MKIFFVALCATALLAGCESMSTRVQQRFTPVPPHARVFAAGPKVVYEAAQQALKNVGLQMGRKSLAEGRIEGYAPIRAGDSIHDARQTTIQIRLFETDTLETRVELLVSEHTEGNFPGGVSQQDLREHSLYGLYYAALQQVLVEKGVPQPAEKP